MTPDINNVRQALRLDLEDADGIQLRGSALATNCSRPFNGILDADPSAVGGRDRGCFPSEGRRCLLPPPRFFFLSFPIMGAGGSVGATSGCQCGIEAWTLGPFSEDASVGTWRKRPARSSCLRVWSGAAASPRPGSWSETQSRAHPTPASEPHSDRTTAGFCAYPGP